MRADGATSMGGDGGGGGNRTRVRKSSAVRPTYLAWSFGSRLAPAGRQADAQPVASTDARGQATRPRTGADVNDAALRLGSLAHQRSEERRVGKECRSRWSPYH